MVLDLQQSDGQALFRRLVQSADVVLESCDCSGFAIVAKQGLFGLCSIL